MMNPRILRMMNKGRHTRDGKVMLNILKYDVMFVVQHWGYLDKESACEFFKYVVDLLSEASKRKPKTSKKSLPKEDDAPTAKDEPTELTGQERKELL